MDQIQAYLPSGEKGYLPYYLFVIGIVAMGNSLQNLATLHYTRRIYNGRFVQNHLQGSANPEDSVNSLKPASSTGKDSEKGRDQVTPLAARLFGSYTFLAGLTRIYASYSVENASLYQLALLTHVVAAFHFTSELLVYKTIKFSGPQGFPFAAAYLGGLWMTLQYGHYVQ
ncbi:hypothetical protein B0H63DRAFT_445822 [Podospora didyma]|uniref:Ergosterol biosynthetic protein 28 n=1 Tax=Podospora didyma TaxID=330526 RepID=A0AAE0NYA6_9PEZI|nr:hypothetical protein B0H63DRAFT_445822 [Podospora didyma]